LSASQTNLQKSNLAEQVALFAQQQQQFKLDFRRLEEKVSAAHLKYLTALAGVDAARQKRLKSLESKLAVSNLERPPGAANPTLTFLICGLLAVASGVAAARSARKPEPVFRNAAEVRQKLELTVLGILPFKSHQSPREQPFDEPRWIGRLVFASEVCLVAMVAVLIVSASADRHFFRELLANPLSACSQKWWC
jgi:hypothetical protein